MKEKEPTEKPEPKSTDEPEATAEKPDKPAPKTAATHDSNPFTTTISGIKKLFSLNMGPLVGVTLFSLVIYGLIFAVGIVMLIGGIGFTFNHMPEYFVSLNTSYPEFGDFASSMSDAAIYATWIAGLVVILLLAALIQAMQLALVYDSSIDKRIEFSELFKLGGKRTLPLLGYSALVLGAVVLAAILLIGIAAMMQPFGIFLLVLSPIAIIAGIYVAFRLSFANLAIVTENLGPIDAIKRSWAITRKQVAEVIGVAAASSLIVVMPITLIQTIAQNIGGPVGGTLQLIMSVIGLAATTIVMVAISQRFVQLRAIYEGKASRAKIHAMNYLAILFLIIASMFVGALTPPQDPSQSYPENYDYDSLEQELRKLEQEQGSDIEYSDPDFQVN